MIGRIVSRYGELSGATPQVPPPVMYAVFDGLFHPALLRRLAGMAPAHVTVDDARPEEAAWNS